MMFSLVRYDITPMDFEQWEERELTDEELCQILNIHTRRQMRTQRFWVIKKSVERNPRSVNYYEYEPDQKPIVMNELKHEWSEFVIDLMRISLDALSQNKTLSWSRHLNCMFYDYLSHESNAIRADNMRCESFDEFLYSKISKTLDWYWCNKGANFFDVVEWCQAWKRIYSIVDTDFVTNKSWNYKVRSESYLQDASTLIEWLATMTKTKQCQKTESGSIRKIHRADQSSHLVHNSVDILLCFLTTFSINECKKVMTSLKKTIY